MTTSHDRLEGYKELKRCLEGLGVPSSRWTITRWSLREHDPFPLLKTQAPGIGRIRYFVYADRAAVEEWVRRNYDPPELPG